MRTKLFRSSKSYEIEYEGNSYVLVEELHSLWGNDILIYDSEGDEVDDEDLADAIIGNFVDDIQSGIVNKL